ncbi:hypothetical protein N5F23_07010 [Pseudomonas sichuanensis]|uniref:hypothetical protein n=1 Tax=Pseudomonas sichuanensis TaxID=2213015 RepID=UPI00244B7F53|nr:hypothetical protein [Pseudomonas sichuanensis]MDH0730274.1 hypothetical protein [Pseudomonas sichuanensis]MDH1582340.1 hypothetical protein [Pseudomonas sichuanensis]MDH1591737.1 hypothetical protein [Pseudomonas sichuanensis]MDH1599534.1 hypothetical protein [Pseudomonas sichuanensis]
MSLLCIGSTLLTACDNSEPTNPSSAPKVASKPVIGADGMTDEGRKAAQQLEDMNKPLKVELAAPSQADDAAYINVLSKLSAIQIYTSQRSWDESDEEIAKSVSGSILVQSDLPLLYEYEQILKSSEDAFKKRELVEKISGLIKSEAAKLNGNIRVRMLVDADLKPYDFTTNSFGNSNCLFSEKLDYTKSEMSNPNAFSKAEKPRCYLQPSTTNFRVGLMNGSKLNLKIDDESLAKKVEGQRQGAKFEIFGYVASIERERHGGTLGDARYIMINPQRIKLIGTGSGEVLFSQNL